MNDGHLGEREISTLLDTAASGYAPAADLRDRIGRRATTRRRRSRAAAGAVAVAVLLVVAVGIDVGGRRDVSIDTGSSGAGAPGTTAPAAVATHPVDWDTGLVTLHADAFHILAGGVVNTGDDPGAQLKGDPGTPNEYVTFERTWHEHGSEMRLFIYFKSDGKDWWSDEIRTYGNPGGGWYYYTGEFFRRPLGQPFVGDFEAPAQPDGSTVVMKGLRLQAFVPPAACADAADFHVEVLFPEIRTTTDPQMGFGVNVRLRDAQCHEVKDTSAFRFDYAIDDPSIATLSSTCNLLGPQQCRTGADLKGDRAGATTLRVTVVRVADGATVATGTMAVRVETGTDAASSTTPVPPKA